MALEKIKSLRFGEIGGKTDRIQEAISEMAVSYTADGASQIEFSVFDPDLAMSEAGYFVIRRLVRYQGQKFEIAAVEVEASAGRPDTVRVTCRSQAVQKLKRQKGAKNFGKIAPSTFALQMANSVGLGFFGETTAVKEAIVRAANENNDESSWDVLRRLAQDLEFLVFEDGEILYFSSEKFLIQEQPTVRMVWPSNVTSPYYLHSVTARRSDDDPLGSELNLVIDRTNATQIRPGMGITLVGMPYFEQKHMVTSVEYEEASTSPVSVSARTPVTTEDVGCESQTFRRGSRGVCVRRIQQAVGGPVDGIFRSETEDAVKSFQTANGLSATGIVDAATWEKIIDS